MWQVPRAASAASSDDIHSAQVPLTKLYCPVFTPRGLPWPLCPSHQKTVTFRSAQLHSAATDDRKIDIVPDAVQHISSSRVARHR